ncbi:MAG: sensor histidine kinase [Actinobacteria bacterium]|nr:sensor histidine kinase [Actinomycetota bacterium]
MENNKLDTIEVTYKKSLLYVAAFIGWVTIITLLINSFIQTDQPILNRVITWIFLAIAIVSNSIIYTRFFIKLISSRWSDWVFFNWSVVLVIFSTVLILLTGLPIHGFYLIYFPLLLFTTVILKRMHRIFVLILALASYSVVFFFINHKILSVEFIFHTVALVSIWFLGSYLSSLQISLTEKYLNELENNKNLNVELVKQNEEKKGLLKQILSTQEDERRRISRELHDNVTQYLNTIVLKLESLGPGLTDMNKKEIDEIKNISKMSLIGLREAIYDLRPTILDDLGLSSAISWYLREKFKGTSIKFSMHLDSSQRRYKQDFETNVFRIVQEAATNTLKHANALVVSVEIREENGFFILQFIDDGIGREEYGDAQRGLSHFGIMGMRERAQILGGEIEFSNLKPKGFEVLLKVPIGEDKD